MSDKIRQRLEQTGSLQVLTVMLLGQPTGRRGGTGEQQAELKNTLQEKNTAPHAGVDHHILLQYTWQSILLDLNFLINQNLHFHFVLCSPVESWKIE